MGMSAEFNSLMTAAPLIVRLFGPGEVLRGEIALERTRTRKEMWLLALLVLRSGQIVERRWLANILWPDSQEHDALSNLRRSLSNLRSVLGDQAERLISPTSHTLCFDATGAEIDVLAFDAACARGDGASLRDAIALYRGPFLEGCNAEWVAAEQQQREFAYLRALQSLAATAVIECNPDQAVCYLRQVVSIDPFRENDQRMLIEVLAATGDTAGAILAYRKFRLLLHHDLCADPSPETMEVYRKLRARGTHSVRTQPEAHAYTPGPSEQSSLPRPLTPLIGREREIQTLVTCLPTVRLLSLLGPGGVGKTRLATAVAEAAAHKYPEGVWFVDIAPVSLPSLVARAVATTLGVAEESERPLVTTLVNALSHRTLLLILDNCEHLIAACAELAQMLLDRCPHLRVMTTSRQPLGITGERRWRVPSLHVPEATQTDLPQDLAALARCEAIQLFVERAGWNEVGFHLTADNSNAVVQICRRLDGIPLALELAAARAQTMDVAQIAARLDDRFHLLTGGSRTAMPRHQTLRATMDWSYHLLSPAEQALLSRLSIFAGGWKLEAAEAVCTDTPKSEFAPPQDDAAEWIEARRLPHLLGDLVEKSLVVYTAEAEQGRYHLLETVRQYALAQCRPESQRELARRHLACFTTVAANWEVNRHHSSDLRQLDLVAREHANFQAALSWSLTEPEAIDAGLLLTTRLGHYWTLRDHLKEAQEWMGRLLDSGLGSPQNRSEAFITLSQWAGYGGDVAGSQSFANEGLALAREIGELKMIAQALSQVGVLACNKGQFESAQSAYQESLSLFETLEEMSNIFDARSVLGWLAWYRGDMVTAYALLEENLRQARQAGNQYGIINVLGHLIHVARTTGNYAYARALCDENMTLHQRTGHKQNIANAYNHRGHIEICVGDYAAAAADFEAAIQVARELRSPTLETPFLINRAKAARLQGDLVRASALCRKAMLIYRDRRDRRGLLNALVAFANLAVAQEQNGVAARLLGTVSSIWEAMEDVRPVTEQRLDREVIEAARAGMEADDFATAWAAGRAMSLDQSLQYILDHFQA